MYATTEAAVRELDRRTNDGFDVRLLWDSQRDRVFVTVDDERHGELFALEVDASDALEAFHHPFTYPGDGYRPRVRPGAQSRS
jgi:hypothetical protein